MLPQPLVEFQTAGAHLRLTAFAILLGLAGFVATSWIYRHPSRRAAFGRRPALCMSAVVLGGFGVAVLSKPLAYGSQWSPDGSTYATGWLVGSLMTSVVLAHFLRLSLRRMLDTAMPGFLLAASLGRLGCLAAGCCHGPSGAWPWAWSMPGAPDGEGVYFPTQLVHALASMASFASVAWVGRLVAWRSGRVACIAATLYALERVSVGFLRVEPAVVGPLTIAQCAGVLWLVALPFAWRACRADGHATESTGFRQERGEGTSID